jgi:CBS domain-containing membrane protein
MEIRVEQSTVSDVMTRKVTSLSPQNSVLEAVNLFTECGFRHLPVVDAAGKLAGVLSDRDVLRAMVRTPHSDRTSIASIMVREPVTALPDMPLTDVIDVVIFHRIGCLPILDAAGKLCGIVTTTDLLGAFHDLLHRMQPARQRKSPGAA